MDATGASSLMVPSWEQHFLHQSGLMGMPRLQSKCYLLSLVTPSFHNTDHTKMALTINLSEVVALTFPLLETFLKNCKRRQIPSLVT